jgi:hypothetical protein
MSGKNYWTSPRSEGGWSVRKAGAERAASIHDSQEDAWKEAKRLARGAGSEAILKGRDGQIRARNSYGNDPFPPKG